MLQRFGLKNFTSSKNGFKDLLISNKNDFKEVLLKTSQVEKDNLLLHKDAQLLALKNKSDLAKEMAHAVCKIESLIIEKSHHTNELIRKLNEQNLRDKLHKIEEELTALKLRVALSPLPVGC